MLYISAVTLQKMYFIGKCISVDSEKLARPIIIIIIIIGFSYIILRLWNTSLLINSVSIIYTVRQNSVTKHSQFV